MVVTVKVTSEVFWHWLRSAQVRPAVDLATATGVWSMVAPVSAGGLMATIWSDSCRG